MIDSLKVGDIVECIYSAKKKDSPAKPGRILTIERIMYSGRTLMFKEFPGKPAPVYYFRKIDTSIAPDSQKQVNVDTPVIFTTTVNNIEILYCKNNVRVNGQTFNTKAFSSCLESVLILNQRMSGPRSAIQFSATRNGITNPLFGLISWDEADSILIKLRKVI